MQRPKNPGTTINRPQQAPKPEVHGVWQIATEITFPIATGVSLPTDTKLETFEWNGE